MTREIIVTAKTIEEAVVQGAESLGIEREEVQSEVLEQPKKGILGFGSQLAKVRVFYTTNPIQAAENFVRQVLSDMGIEGYNLETEVIADDDIKISVSGGELGIVIGRHGDVLDALQYLTNLAANRAGENFIRVSVDAENYRSKREETLRSLARRMAQKAIKAGRNISLEPMNSYERRIIHSEIQDIPDVSTFSIGNDNDRRIVVSPEKKQKAQTPKAFSAPAPSIPAATPTVSPIAPISPVSPPARAISPVRTTPSNSPKKKFPLPEITLPPVKREPIVKAKSIDELNLGDPDDGVEFNPK